MNMVTLDVNTMDYEKLQKIWKVAKQIIEIILAALAGAAVGSCTAAVNLVASLF